MPIRIALIDELYCPVAICDVCGERVIEHGNVQYPVDAAGKPGPELYVTHKSACAAQFDRRLGRGTLTVDLDVFLFQLVENANVNLDQAREHDRLVSR